MKKNNSGFTLVELIAVIVILIIVSLIAVTISNKQMEKARLNAFIEETNTFVKGAQEKYSYDRSNGNIGEDLFHNAIKGKVCYSVEQQLLDKYVEKLNNKYTGSVEICYGLDCEYQYKVWITDGEHFIDGETSVKDISQIKDSYSTDYPLTCGIEATGGGGTGGDLKTAEFEFSENEYVMTIIKDGVYSLEGWGAQGGRINQYRGGYGGYAYTEVTLHVGDKLYIQVGGQGDDWTSSKVPQGGYNGGANGNTNNRAAGGGSTSITTKSGHLWDPILSDYVYLVAGGGSGSYNSSIGRNGGGYIESGNYVGQDAATPCCNPTRVYGRSTGTDGGGGGYVGSSSNYGGSGYIGNPLTKNGVMYGYGVPESDAAYTKTVSTTNVSEKPISQYAKQASGYAKITYIGDYTS